MADLEFEYPLGDPSAETCRWCEAERVENGGFLLCPRCDPRERPDDQGR